MLNKCKRDFLISFFFHIRNKNGQVMREEDDCGLAVVLACPCSTRTFKRGYEYRFHVKNCSETKCNKYGKGSTNNTQLKNHYVKHTESICCDICLNHFSGQQALKRHKTSLHDNIKFECSICKKHFSTQRNMLRHKKMHSVTAAFFFFFFSLLLVVLLWVINFNYYDYSLRL